MESTPIARRGARPYKRVMRVVTRFHRGRRAFPGRSSRGARRTPLAGGGSLRYRARWRGVIFSASALSASALGLLGRG